MNHPNPSVSVPVSIHNVPFAISTVPNMSTTSPLSVAPVLTTAPAPAPTSATAPHQTPSIQVSALPHVPPQSINQANLIPPQSQSTHSTSNFNPAIVERSPGERYVRFAEILGNGAYKHVYRAYDTTEGIEVAWNVVNLSGTPKTDRSRIVNEVRLLERLHHANIISFYGSWVNRELEQVIFVTEILSSGTLKSFINKVQVIRWKIAKRWAIQILKGLEYLHKQDPPVIHRDLKCDNIFINGTSGDLRIGDFGLSTNISNRSNKKALSVLGTPEFMAPELYDEAYDEKVDIYAFGMCMLEIFTKEVPYSECRNPAQIFKKVTKGILPASLSRLKSQEAKDFISICLGTLVNGNSDDENAQYERPSASELLQHPFLMEKGDGDDLEVELYPPLQDMVITERSVHSQSNHMNGVGRLGSDDSKKYTSDVEKSRDGTIQETKPSPQESQDFTERIDDDEHDNLSVDHFSAMPDNESNMKKVTVLMGRDLQISNNSDVRILMNENGTRKVSADSKVEANEKGQDLARDINQVSNIQNLDVSQTAIVPQTRKYIVAANIEKPIESDITNDVIELTITLPIGGKTQDVQFSFHLVEDDPVQVAKEMVTELPIPESAILEISEIISALACEARVDLDTYRKQLSSMQQSLPHGSEISLPPIENKDDLMMQQMSSSQIQMQQPSVESSLSSNVAIVNASGIMRLKESHLSGQTQAAPVQMDILSPATDLSQTQQIPMNHAASQQLQQLGQQNSSLMQNPMLAASQQSILSSDHIQSQKHTILVQTDHTESSGNKEQQLQQHSVYSNKSSLSIQTQSLPAPIDLLSPSVDVTKLASSQDSVPLHHTLPQHQPGIMDMTIFATSQQPSAIGNDSENQGTYQMHQRRPSLSNVHIQQFKTDANDKEIIRNDDHNQRVPTRSSQHRPDLSQKVPIKVKSMNPSAETPHERDVTMQNNATQNYQQIVHVKSPSIDFLSDNFDTSTAKLGSQTFSKLAPSYSHKKGASLEISSTECDAESYDSKDSATQNLKKDYEKNVLHATKAFDTRMDNLQRSMEVKESEYKKMIEKHKKEIQEFEKRKKMAENEQLKRLEVLKRQWEDDKEKLTKHILKKDQDSVQNINNIAPLENLLSTNLPPKSTQAESADLIDFSADVVSKYPNT